MHTSPHNNQTDRLIAPLNTILTTPYKTSTFSGYRSSMNIQTPRKNFQNIPAPHHHTYSNTIQTRIRFNYRSNRIFFAATSCLQHHSP